MLSRVSRVSRAIYMTLPRPVGIIREGIFSCAFFPSPDGKTHIAVVVAKKGGMTGVRRNAIRRAVYDGARPLLSLSSPRVFVFRYTGRGGESPLGIQKDTAMIVAQIQEQCSR